MRGRCRAPARACSVPARAASPLRRDCGQRTAALAAGGGEHRRRLADQATGAPQAARRVEEGLHLGGHHAEAGGEAKDEAWRSPKKRAGGRVQIASGSGSRR